MLSHWHGTTRSCRVADRRCCLDATGWHNSTRYACGLTMQEVKHHDAELVHDSLSMEESQQASLEHVSTTNYTGCGVQHLLQFVGHRFRCTRQDSVAIINATWQTNVRMWPLTPCWVKVKCEKPRTDLDVHHQPKTSCTTRIKCITIHSSSITIFVTKRTFFSHRNAVWYTLLAF